MGVDKWKLEAGTWKIPTEGVAAKPRILIDGGVVRRALASQTQPPDHEPQPPSIIPPHPSSHLHRDRGGDSTSAWYPIEVATSA